MREAGWDLDADVVVIGFGATALSGGIVYAGGGTPQQAAAGVPDSREVRPPRRPVGQPGLAPAPG